ncbi:Ger(x)C family spore germination protein [Wukongibacter baidiensis]|uniref:Ger(x)C family spore germination protein n=1 Tax=Wukongibacter baidiensis TaxID=1723361 RepID=UPI003D7F4395
MGKKKKLIITIVIAALTVTGCWNYSEISDKRIIAGSALDFNKEQEKLKLTVELVKPVMGGQQTQMEHEIYESVGDNMFNAARNMISKTGKKIFWSHAKVLILSEELINNEDKFLSVIDFVKRDAETRDDIMLLVSREKTAGEILKTDAKVQDIISFHLEDMLQNHESISKYRAVPLWKFVDELAGEGISATLPTVQVSTYNNKALSQIFGTAVFKGAKTVGWLSGSETKAFLFVIDELKGGTIVIEEKELAKEPVRIAFEIFKNKTKVKPLYKGERLTMKIDIKTTVNINEIDGDIDFMDEKNLEIIQKNGEETIKNMVESVIKKVQKEYKSDIFGFGAIISREMPDLWKELKPDWNNVFSKLDVKVNSTLEIRGSALRSKTIKVGD